MSWGYTSQKVETDILCLAFPLPSGANLAESTVPYEGYCRVRTSQVERALYSRREVLKTPGWRPMDRPSERDSSDRALGAILGLALQVAVLID